MRVGFARVSTKKNAQDISIAGQKQQLLKAGCDRALQTSSSFSSPISGEGGLILVVYMTLSNTGKESGDMTWTSFTVEDANGFEYSELKGRSFDLSLWRDAMGLGDSDDQLFPGQNKQIAKVFRVKRDATGMKLTAGNYKFLLY